MRKKLTLDQLVDALDFVPEDVTMAAAQQPALFDQVSEYRIAKLQAKIEANSRLEVAKSKLSLDLRKEARNDGERLTEANLVDLIRSDRSIRKLQSEADQAEVADESAKLLLEAYRQRKSCLEIIGYLATSGLGAKVAAEMTAGEIAALRKRVSAKYPGRD